MNDKDKQLEVETAPHLNLHPAAWKLMLLTFVFLAGCFALENADIWWHLRAGQLIWERGQVPQTDWFTYTNPESPWIDLHWTFQLFAAGLWSIGGSAALILAKSAIGTLTIAIGMSIGKREWSSAVTVACWLIGALIFVGRFYVRPEMFSLLFLVSTLAVLYHSRTRPWLIWLLPVIQLFWVNVQGLFVLQFVVVGAFFVDQLFRRFVQRQTESSSELRPMKNLISTMTLMLLATLCNPYGLRGTTFPLTLFARVRGPDRDFFLDYSGEFASMAEFLSRASIFSNISTACMFEIAVAVLITFGLLWRVKQFNLYRVLLFFGFAYLAWQMNRNAVLYAVVATMVLRLNIGEWWDLQKEAFLKETSKPKKKKGPESKKELPFVQYRKMFEVCILIFVTGLIIAIPTGIYHPLRPTLFNRHFSLGETDWYPHSGARFLQDERLPKQIYASHLGVASVCIFHTVPEKKVFADARLETNTMQVLRAHTEVLKRIQSGEDYQSLLRATFRDENSEELQNSKLPAIFIDNKTLVTAPAVYFGLKRDHWRCVFFDDNIKGVFTGSQEDANRLQNGNAVFVTEQQAEELGLPAADVSLLEGLLQSIGAKPN